MNALAESTISIRDLRQRSLVPPERLARIQAVVIGVGAVGRQVAWQLTALGIPRLILFDHDRVEVENLAPQGYWPEDLGKAKVMATADLCQRIHPEVQVNPRAERFKRSGVRDLPLDLESAIFVAVDSIATRRWIWEAIRAQAAFLADGRMNGEVIRVLASAFPVEDDDYPRTFFDASEAFAGACTSKSTIYTACITAGLMVAQFTKWLRRQPVDADVTLNLLAGEWMVPAPSRP